MVYQTPRICRAFSMGALKKFSVALGVLLTTSLLALTPLQAQCEDLDGDGRYDVFEDLNYNGILDGCLPDPTTGQNFCFPPWGAPAPWDANIFAYGEDADLDGRLTPPGGCEGTQQEDINCDGFLSQEYSEDVDGDGILDPNEDINGNGVLDCEDANHNGILDPGEDLNGNALLDCEDLDHDGRLDFDEDRTGNGILDWDDSGIPCNNPTLCPDGYELDADRQSTRGNGRLDSEDRNGNHQLDTVSGSGHTSFPFWVDDNYDGVPQIGEFQSPSLDLCDADGDGVIDPLDDCPATANPDQSDIDGDGAGDACDPFPNNANNMQACLDDRAACTSDLTACTSTAATCDQSLAAANADLAEAQLGLDEVRRLQALPFGRRTSSFTCSGLLCPEITAVIQQLLAPEGLIHGKRNQPGAPRPTNKSR